MRLILNPKVELECDLNRLNEELFEIVKNWSPEN